eukprot:TRINITY_DN1418_c2_g1_i1.p2 TRINITY_DN1418_c2_g1~~TRINITY_DN1418_c2_g1_i1.p2  ORF type:complete len:167 (+),score=49.62 TRINITY_DN1418_c2_g1_i1:1303-1803(+)
MKLLLLAAMVGCALGGAKEDGESYLEVKAQEENVYKLPSGMLVKVLKKGDGEKSPNAGDACSVHYAGTLTDGAKFDSSYDRGTPATFAPNQVIKGWTEALQLMCEGDKWELHIPYSLAYGERGRPPKIPAFAPLVFDVELLNVKAGGKPCNRDALEALVGSSYDEM